MAVDLVKEVVGDQRVSQAWVEEPVAIYTGYLFLVNPLVRQAPVP